MNNETPIIVMPNVGQRWRLKSHITSFEYDATNSVKVLEVWSDRVVLEMSWSSRGHVGKCIDTFLKQYEPV